MSAGAATGDAGPPWPSHDEPTELRQSRRWWRIIVGLVALGLAIELLLELTAAPQAYVELINNGQAAMVDVRFEFAGRTERLARIDPGERAGVDLSGPAGRLIVRFDQKGSALEGIPIDDFNPAELAGEHQKLVLMVGEQAFARYPEDNPTRRDRLWQRALDWLRKPN